jgi:hypothetical protein
MIEIQKNSKRTGFGFRKLEFNFSSLFRISILISDYYWLGEFAPNGPLSNTAKYVTYVF